MSLQHKTKIHLISKVIIAKILNPLWLRRHFLATYYNISPLCRCLWTYVLLQLRQKYFNLLSWQRHITAYSFIKFGEEIHVSSVVMTLRIGFPINSYFSSFTDGSEGIFEDQEIILEFPLPLILRATTVILPCP